MVPPTPLLVSWARSASAGWRRQPWSLAQTGMAAACVAGAVFAVAGGSALAQSAPAQSAPAQSAPAQSAPAQSAPAQSAPVRVRLGDDCIAMPAGDCQAVAGGLLAAGVARTELSSGAQLVAVAVPTAGRVALEIRVRPTGGLTPADLQIAWLLGREDGGVGGAGRRQRRHLLGATQRVWVDGSAVVTQLDAAGADLAELSGLEAGRLRDFAPTQALSQRSLHAVAARQRVLLSRPDERLTARARATLNPPLGGDSGRIATEADNDTELDLRSRYRSAWTGAGVTVVVAGDIDPVIAVGQLQAAMGQLWTDPSQGRGPDEVAPAAAAGAGAGAGARPPTRQAQGVDSLVPANVVGTFRSQGVQRARIAVTWASAPVAPGSLDEAARAVLRELLVGEGGPLWSRLVREQGLVTRLWSPQDDHGLIVLAELRGDAHPGAVLATLEAAADALRDGEDPALAAHIERARLHLARATMLSLTKPGDWATAVAEVVASGGRVEDVDARLDALRRVDLDTVLRAAAQLLVPEARQEVELLPVPAPPIADSAGEQP